MYIAAFAVSAYASSYYRAGSKPFNPVLGETYECIREDKGFQFFAEQVLYAVTLRTATGYAAEFQMCGWNPLELKAKYKIT